MLPASVFVEENERLQVGGTIWSGESVLDGAIRVEWSFSPLTTLAQFAWSADWHITGAANDLTGRVTQAGEQLQLANISGQTDGVLIDTMFPNLPLSCDFTADLAVESLFLGGEGQKGVGNLRTGPVSCAAKGLAALPVELPALEGSLVPTPDGTSGALTAAAQNERLVEMRLSPDGRLSIWPTQQATARLPLLRGERFDTVVE
ncbi:MAG: hypothetical protein WA954_04920 [Parerythrobacter sp.]